VAVTEPDSHQSEQFIRELTMLERLDVSDVRALASRAMRRRYKAGTRVLNEGAPGDSLHIVVKGRLNVVKSTLTGGETTVATLGPGQCFGEQAVLDGFPRSASVVAAVATETLMLTRESFFEWMHERPPRAFAIMETLSLRLRSMDRKFADLVSLDITHRLAKQLLSLAAIHDIEAVANNGTLLLKYTQAELAQMLGVTRETVNKQINQFKEDRWVTVTRGALTITDMAALKRYQ
jgi:CRP-like cAMP-binding protein